MIGLRMKKCGFKDLDSLFKTCIKMDTLLFTGGNSFKNGPEYFFPEGTLKRLSSENYAW